MAKNLKIESTDSKAERDFATLQPYTTVSVTVPTARQPIRRPDGGTEAAEPDVETSSKVVPGRELMDNAAEYDRRVQEFKKQQPNFSTLVNQPTEIPVSAHDQILRMRNGPEIALFLGPTGFLVGPRSQVQTSTVEIDRVDEVLFVAKSSSRIFHPLNFGVDGFAGGVGDRMG